MTIAETADCPLNVIFLNKFSRLFDYFILLTIAANCVVLLLDAPQPKGDTTDLNRALVSGIKNLITLSLPSLVRFKLILGYYSNC